MDKLEAVQKVLRFSERVRNWCETEHSVFFDDFDAANVEDYGSIIGDLADTIIKEGMKDGILDEEDFNPLA